MSRYNTNNPVPSNEVKDFSDNAQIVDEIVHSQQTTTKDRFGNDLKTWRGIQDDANEAISQFGYITMDSFEDGNILTLPNQVLRHEATGEYYRWDGEFPVGGKVVPPGSTPESTGGIGKGTWVSVGDASLRGALSSPSGAGMIGYGSSTVQTQLDRHTTKTIINVSAFGNTGTEQNGSDEAWNNAFAYALSIAPKWKNNYPSPQEWFDLSGFEFIADGNVYPKTSIGLRCTYGGTINMSIVAPDDHTGTYLIDMSIDRGVVPNRGPLYTRFMGAVHCRYKCSGMNLGGSGSTTTEHMRVDQFLVYGIDTDGSDTQTSGGHTIGIGTIVEQRQWSAGGDADFPPVVTTGTGIHIRSHDNRLVGATISYCKLRCVRIKGQSNRLVAGTHLYSGGRQALLHESTSGNTLIDSCWLDSSRLQLDGGFITITNNLIYLTQGTDSETGILTGGSASNILIKNNSFLGYTGGTPVYFGKGPFGDKTVVCYGNRYLPGMNNTDVITTLAMSVVGESTAGTVTMDPSSGFTVTYDGVYVNFTATIRWSSFTGGTGAIGVYGLPFVADRITPMDIAQFTNNDLFKGVSPIKHTSGTSLRFVKQDGTNVMANDAGASSGYLCVRGSYRPV